jgi:Fe-S-cluster containining protein
MGLITPDLRYSCMMCSACCRRDWDIKVEDGIRAGLVSADWGGSPPNGGRFFAKSKRGETILARKGGDCIFLDGKKCSVHSGFGAARKPATCRIYPYMFADTPDGTYVGLSFACPAVLAGSGEPVSSDPLLEELAGLARAAGRILVAHPTLGGRELGWDDYLLLESRALEALSLKTPLWRRLMAIHLLAAGARENRADIRHFLVSADVSALASRPENACPSTQKRDALLAIVSGLQGGRGNAGGRASGLVGRLGAMFGGGGSKAPAQGWEDSELADRYFTHLVFKKTLAVRNDIVENLNMMILAYASVRRLAMDSAAAAGRHKPSSEDIQQAVAAVELSLMTHSYAYAELMKSPFTGPLMSRMFGDPDYAATLLCDG